MFPNAVLKQRSEPVGDPAARLSAVAVSAAQIEAALRVISTLPHAEARNPFAQAAALQEYARARSPGSDLLLATALHARVTALAKWTAASDPGRQSDAESAVEATARFPLSELPGGIGFEPCGFQEMILFIEELPW
jgi:hypothetical protein